MNVERIHALADHIEALKDTTWDAEVPGFCMTLYSYDDCCMPACMAGHAVDLFSEKGFDHAMLHTHLKTIAVLACKLLKLDISDRARLDLFEPVKIGEGGWDYTAQPGDPGHITAEHAAACLRLLARTGKIDWDGSAPITQEAA